MRHRIAQRGRISADGCGAADTLQQQVCGGVVAVLDGGGAQIGQAHAAFPDVLPGDRRVVEQIAPAVSKAPLQTLLLLIHPLQHRRHGEKLEGAAQRETLGGTMLDAPAAGRIQRGHAEPARYALFDRGKAIVVGRGRPRLSSGAGTGGGEQQRGGNQEGAAIRMESLHGQGGLRRFIG